MKLILNRRIWIFSLFLFTTVSCKRQLPYDKLVGHWKIVEDTVGDNSFPPPFDARGRGGYFEFINDSLVDTKRRYYKIITSGIRDREYRFLGTVTKYQILDDSLRLFNPEDSVWETVGHLKNLADDRMTLVSRSGKESTFLRHSYVNDSTQVDAIALSSSGCFGTCPIINIIIESNGDVTFYGERYIDKIGFFEAQISKEKYEQIRLVFSKAGIKNLEQDFAVGHTDDETISTTFVSKNKFVNSIKDYGEAGPDELVWGYSSLRYLFQDLELRKLDSANVSFYLDLHYFMFEKGQEICDLTQSESFLLWHYLRKGVLTGQKANPKYTIKFVRNYTWFPSYDEMEDPYRERAEERVKKIITDGRLYTFDVSGQKPVTIDIGFNFLDVNQKFLNFREKGEYD